MAAVASTSNAAHNFVNQPHSVPLPPQQETRTLSRLDGFRFQTIGREPDLLKRFSDIQEYEEPIVADMEDDGLEYVDEPQQDAAQDVQLFTDTPLHSSSTLPLSGNEHQDRMLLDQPTTSVSHSSVPSFPSNPLSSSSATFAHPSGVQPALRHSTTPEHPDTIRDRAEWSNRPTAVSRPNPSSMTSPPYPTDFSAIRHLQTRLASSLASLTPISTASALLLIQSAKEQSVSVTRLAQKTCESAKQAFATAQTAVIAAEDCLMASKVIEGRVNEAMLAIERISSSEGASEWRWNQAIESIQTDLHNLSDLVSQQEIEACRHQRNWELKWARLRGRAGDRHTGAASPPGTSRPIYTPNAEAEAIQHLPSASEEHLRQLEEAQRKQIAAETALEEERNRARAEAVVREQELAERLAREALRASREELERLKAEQEARRVEEEKRRLEEEEKIAQARQATLLAERVAADREKVRQRLQKEKEMALSSAQGSLAAASNHVALLPSKTPHTAAAVFSGTSANPTPFGQSSLHLQAPLLPAVEVPTCDQRPATDAAPVATSTTTPTAPVITQPPSAEKMPKNKGPSSSLTQPASLPQTQPLQLAPATNPPPDAAPTRAAKKTQSKRAVPPPSNPPVSGKQGASDRPPAPPVSPNVQEANLKTVAPAGPQLVKAEPSATIIPSDPTPSNGWKPIASQPLAAQAPASSEPVIKTEPIVVELPPAAPASIPAPEPTPTVPPPTAQVDRDPPDHPTAMRHPPSLPPKPKVSVPLPMSSKSTTPAAEPMTSAASTTSLSANPTSNLGTRREEAPQVPPYQVSQPSKEPTQSRAVSYNKPLSASRSRNYDHYSPPPPRHQSPPPRCQSPPRRRAASPPPRRRSPPPARGPPQKARLLARGDHYSRPTDVRRSPSPQYPKRPRPRPRQPANAPPASSADPQSAAAMDSSRALGDSVANGPGTIIGRKRPRNEESEVGPLHRRFQRDYPDRRTSGDYSTSSSTGGPQHATAQHQQRPFSSSNNNPRYDPPALNASTSSGSLPTTPQMQNAPTPPPVTIPAGPSHAQNAHSATTRDQQHPPPLAQRIDTSRVGNDSYYTSASTPDSQLSANESNQSRSEWAEHGGHHGGTNINGGAPTGPRSATTTTNPTPGTALLHRFDIPHTSPSGRGHHRGGGRGGGSGGGSRGSSTNRGTSSSYGRYQNTGRSLFDRLERD